MKDDNRTEQATPRRLQEARNEGKVAQSEDLSRTLVLIGALLILFTLGSKTAAALFQFSQKHWTQGAWLSVDSDVGLPLTWAEGIRPFLPLFFWFGACALILPIVTAVASRGWLFLPQKVIPDFGRLKPKGVSDLFSIDGLYRAGVGLVKILFCGWIVFRFFRGQSDRLVEIYRQAPSQFPAAIRNVLVPPAIQIGLFFLLLAAIDLLYRRWKFARDLRMTPDEIRREAKEESGSPELKSRQIEMIRSISRDSFRKKK